MRTYKPLDGENGLGVERDGAVAILKLARPAKRNAVNDATIVALGAFFQDCGDDVKSVLLTAEGDHFCAGLDLSEHRLRGAIAVMLHSRLWHGVLNAVQFAGLPIVSVLRGAVVGGGLEIAATTHVRVAEETAFYALPEASRGIYVGGGASVRVANVIGAGRMAEMMLTGRVYDADEGQAFGISHYKVAKGEGEALGLSLAKKVAENAPLTNFAILNALPHIANMSAEEGLFTEALMAGVAQTSDDSFRLLDDFLEKRAEHLLHGQRGRPGAP